MKKIIFTFFALMTFTLVHAQTDSTKASRELTKEEKAALKAKQEADVMEAYKEAGLSDEQIARCKEAVQSANAKSNELKKKSELTEDEKAAAKKIISDEKNATLKSIMGEDAYRKYNAARKRQKASAPQGQ